MKKIVTILYIQSTNDQADLIRHRIIDMLRTQVIDEGFVEAVPDDPSHDRIIRIGEPLDTGWIPVDGSLTRSFDIAALQANGQAISRDLMTNVIVVQVCGDELIELWLYCQGTLTDSYTNDPSMNSASLPQRRWREIKGNVTKWTDLLLPDGDVGVLKKLFRTRPIAPNDVFATIATQIGLNPNHWNGLTDADAFVPLLFQSTHAPHTKTSVKDTPHLLWLSHPVTLENLAGQPFELTYLVRSVGRTSTGLIINLQGSALEQNLLHATSFTIRIRHREPEQDVVRIIELESVTTLPIYAVVNDLSIPDGQSGSEMSLEAWNWQTTIQSQWEHPISITVKGMVWNAGTGQFRIEMYPQEGSLTTGVTLDLPCLLHPMPAISAWMQALLNQRSNKERIGHLLTLYTRRILQVHIVLASSSEANDVFLDAMEQWHAVLETVYPHGYYTVIHSEAQDPRIRSTRIRTRTIPTGKRWKQLRVKLDEPSLVVVTRETPLDLQPMINSDRSPRLGIAGGRLEWRSRSLKNTDTIASQMSLWIDLQTVPAEQHSQLAAFFTTIVDTLFATGQGIQAYLARWKTLPMSLLKTSYEAMLGIKGDIPSSHAWCTQFVRAVTERMWLGPTLLARLENADRLDKHHGVSSLNECIRIDVESPPQFHILESMLMPLIPTVDDWKQAIKS